MNESIQLLKQYAADRSEEAFSKLVSQYIDLVFSVAYRQANNHTQTAEDITQTVFADLASRAPTLSSQTQIGGWLHRHTCYIASNLRRSEQRRLQRENKAMSLEVNANDSDSTWDELAPELDQAIDQLSESDRSAILLRFFEDRNHREIGEALQTTEDTAQKRVSRAVEKLRSLLGQQGVALSVPALITFLEGRCVAAAPDELQSSITSQVKRTASEAGPVKSDSGFFNRLTIGAAAAVLIGMAVILFRPEQSATETPSPNDAGTTPVIAQVSSADQDSSAVSIQAADVVTAAIGTEDGLKLVIQAKATGERISGVKIGHRAQFENRWNVEDLTANRVGEITIPVPLDQLKMLQLITKVDGYADLRLEWHPDRGDVIPEHYTAELVPATRIGGWVVDETGEPVPGAKVGFNHEDAPNMRTRPESFEFAWIEVESDDEGRWEINRINNQMLPLIYGGARHPDYVGSPPLFASRDRAALDSLKAGTYRFELAAAHQVTGRVTDEQGSPIPDATVSLGPMGSSGRRETVSDLEGRFILRGCQPGKQLLTAEASGFAATTIRFEVNADSGPAHLVLKPGRVVTLVVTDQSGDPVSGASVWYDTFGDSHNPYSTAPPPAQVEFSEKTDANGTVVWQDAPARTLGFDVHAKGYMRVNDVQITPDETEKGVVLPTALVVTGTIRDKETGEPVDQVRMVTGWERSHDGGVSWSTLDRFWVDFAGGEFHHSYEEAVISGIPNPGYKLKFEAEGYAPFITRNIAADEGVVELSIELTQATAVDLVVELPNGRPAQQADVAFVRASSHITIVPGGLGRGMGQPIEVTLTDGEGRFRLKPDPEITGIVIAHPEGFLQVPIDRVSPQQPLVIQSWGRLVGSYQFSGMDEAPLTLEVGFGANPGGQMQLHFENFAQELDPEGRFEFKLLPPGTHRLQRRYFHEHNGQRSWSSRTLETFEIQPGETTELQLSTHEVRISVTKPSGFENVSVGAYVRGPGPILPLAALNDREATIAWMQRPEVQQSLMSIKSFQLAQMEEGIWTSSEVTAGDFEAVFRLYEQNGDEFTAFGRARIPFSIEEGDISKNLSVGPDEWEMVELNP